jgi:hypothetical protein
VSASETSDTPGEDELSKQRLDAAVAEYQRVVASRHGARDRTLDPKRQRSRLAVGEWLPKPHNGSMQERLRLRETLVLRITLGPAGLWQVTRRDDGRVISRGFRTKEQARGWIGRAVRQQVLPEGTIEVEQ